MIYTTQFQISVNKIVIIVANKNINKFAQPTSSQVGIGIVHEFQNLQIGIGIVFVNWNVFAN